jgi:hypothetical protein
MPNDIGYLSFYNGSTNLTHPRLYSLQSALQEAIITPDISIQVPLYSAWWTNSSTWNGGCYDVSSQSENCSRICRDSTQFWGHTTTIHNCAVFWRLQELGIASSTADTSADHLSLARKVALFTDQPIVNYNTGFIYGPNSHQYFPALNPIQYCLERTCGAVIGQSCEDLHLPTFDTASSPSISQYTDICPASGGITDHGLNGDVGGIGVSEISLP